MDVLALAPAVVAAKIAEGDAATYLDVRTVAEFVAGHPRGRVLNVPVVFLHPRTGEAHPNTAFLLVITHHLERDEEIVVGADDAGRAASAAEQLHAAGYERVSVMAGDLGAWRAAGLPVTGDNRDGVSYVSLLTAARRAAAAK